MIPTLTLPFDIEGVFSHGSRYYVPMQRRTAIVLAFAACSIFPSFLAGSDELNQRLKRIFDSNAFAGKRFGPARRSTQWCSFIIKIPRQRNARCVPTPMDTIIR